MTSEREISGTPALASRPLRWTPRSKTFLGGLSIGLALGLVAWRATETTSSWFESVRLLISLGAIGFICFAPFQSVMKRALTVVALEAFAGIVIFAFVDAPVVLQHRSQIVAYTISLQDVVVRLERSVLRR